MTETQNCEFTARSGMRYTRRGAGRPIALLHGWCLNGGLWMYAEERFSRGFDVIVPDLAGFGRSRSLGAPYSLKRYRADIEALLEELDLHSVMLVGFAFGAAVAMTLAAEGSERVVGIVNVGIPSASATPYERMPKSMRRDWPDFARRSAKALFHNPQTEATLSWIERMFVEAPLPVAIETVGELARLDPPALAQRIALPQLFIHATEDLVAPISLGEECVSRASNGRMQIVQGSGHLIVIDAKEAFHTLLEAHLAPIDVSARSRQPQ